MEITYTNSNGDKIKLGQSPPYFITNLEGFSNVDNEINTIKSPNQDGVSEINSSLSGRPLVIGGEYLFKNRQIGRERLIKTFNPKLKGILRYENGDTIKEIECRPESVPYIASSSLSTVPYIINLFASDPYWKDISNSKEEIAIWRNALEFPLEIVAEGIEMGYREPSLIVNVFNSGDVGCGMIIKFKANATVVNPSLFNVDTREYIKMNRVLVAGEVITINTTFQNKTIKSDINGIKSNAFNDLELSSTFLQLETGDNLFRYDAEDGLDSLEVDIYYTNQYLGV